MKRVQFISLICFYFLFLLWLGGFIIFQQYIRKHPIDVTTKTDAIVVLTGGRNRIVEAVNLYNQGLSELLFISGVDPQVRLEELQEENKVNQIREPNNVILGRQATNTIENAVEVSELIRRYHVKSIRLVTSYYHMPRSIEEILAQNPDVTILQHPVYSKFVSKRWWKKPKSFYLIASEYHKFIFAYVKNLILK